MRVAYNPGNGRVYRTLGDDEAYTPKIPVAFVDVPGGNDGLLADLRATPEQFTTNGTDFDDDGTPRVVNRKADTAKTQLNAADFDAAKKAIEAAAGFKDVQMVLADLVELVARLAEAMGMTPVTPAATVT